MSQCALVGPGVASTGQMHPKSAFIYATVLEGAIRSSVNNGPVVTYRAGESFSEMPGDRHSVSENASKTEPAKLLAVFVVDTDERRKTDDPVRKKKKKKTLGSQRYLLFDPEMSRSGYKSTPNNLLIV